MPLTGSEQILKNLILAEMSKLIGDPKAVPNLDKMAEALANAIVQWITLNGKAAVQTPAPTNGVVIPPGGGPVIVPVVVSDII